MFDALPASVAVFVAATVVIAIAGVSMSSLADRLADRTRIGEAMFGAIFLAGATSLPDFAATLTAAVQGRAELAMSNMMGSMAVNIAFLSIADLVYRQANLEHAAAAPANLSQAALSIALLTLPLIAMTGAEIEVWAIHPITIAILVAYAYGYRLVRLAQTNPMWQPQQTAHTITDIPNASTGTSSTLSLWVQFTATAGVVAIAGWLLMQSARAIADQTVLSDSTVGALLTGVFTSMPELVTTIAAVRRGAVTLAVGNILGTNCFNVVVIATADIAYRGGSIYNAVTPSELLWGLLTILMTTVLLLGLVRRQRFGFAKIGFESLLVLVLWCSAAAVLLLVGRAAD